MSYCFQSTIRLLQPIPAHTQQTPRPLLSPQPAHTGSPARPLIQPVRTRALNVSQLLLNRQAAAASPAAQSVITSVGNVVRAVLPQTSPVAASTAAVIKQAVVSAPAQLQTAVIPAPQPQIAATAVTAASLPSSTTVIKVPSYSAHIIQRPILAVSLASNLMHISCNGKYHECFVRFI